MIFLMKWIKIIMGLLIIIISITSCTYLSESKRLYNSLNEDLSEIGYSDIPKIEFRTTDLLIFYDRASNTIVVPKYNELNTEQKQFISTNLTDPEIFHDLFNWFFIAHEFGHYIQVQNDIWELSPYEMELDANKFAVQYLIRYDKNKLLKLKNDLLDIRTNSMMSEVILTRENFDENYIEIALDHPEQYLMYQIEMILHHLENEIGF